MRNLVCRHVDCVTILFVDWTKTAFDKMCDPSWEMGQVRFVLSANIPFPFPFVLFPPKRVIFAEKETSLLISTRQRRFCLLLPFHSTYWTGKRRGNPQPRIRWPHFFFFEASSGSTRMITQKREGRRSRGSFQLFEGFKSARKRRNR